MRERPYDVAPIEGADLLWSGVERGIDRAAQARIAVLVAHGAKLDPLTEDQPDWTVTHPSKGGPVLRCRPQRVSDDAR